MQCGNKLGLLYYNENGRKSKKIDEASEKGKTILKYIVEGVEVGK